MNKQQEALKLALDALTDRGQRHPDDYKELKNDAIAAIRSALAEQPAQQQEPVAWVCHGVNDQHDVDFCENEINALPVGTMLYTSPPASKPLTQDMVESCPYDGETLRGAFFDGWLKAEAAHGIKGDA